MSSSNSPCAACKFLRRKCTQECVFAPYFPADQPNRFADVHKVFGASNVAKILNELDKSHREDAVNSLAYEADARIRDPVYGCVGLISHLQQILKGLHVNLELAKKELASMVGPEAMMHMLHDPYLQGQLHPMAAAAAATQGGRGAMLPYNMAQMMGMMPTGPGSGPGPLVIADPQHHQQQPQTQSQQMAIRDTTNINVVEQQQQHHVGQLMMRDAHLQAKQEQQHAMEAQHLAAMMQVREEQEIMRNFDQQQHIGGQFHPSQHHHQLLLQQQQPHQLLRFDRNEYETGAGGDAVEFCQMGAQGTSTSPLLALGGSGFEGNRYQIQQEQQPLLLLQQPQQSESEAVQTIEHQQQPAEFLFHEQPSGSGHEDSRTGGASC